MSIIHDEIFNDGGSLPSGWTFDASFSATGAPGSGITPDPGPYVLQIAAGTTGDVYAIWGTVAGTGDVSCRLRINASGIGHQAWGVLLRASSTAIASPSGYLAYLDPFGLDLTANVLSGGTKTPIGPTVSLSGMSLPEWYDLVFTAAGSLLTVTLQDLGTGDWLDATGQWQSSAQAPISVTDTTIAGAGGQYAGLSGRDGSVYFGEWTLATATAPVLLPAPRPAVARPSPRRGRTWRPGGLAPPPSPPPSPRILRPSASPRRVAPGRAGIILPAGRPGEPAQAPLVRPIRPVASPRRPPEGRAALGPPARAISDRAQTPLIGAVRPHASPRHLPAGRAAVGSASPSPSDQSQTPLVPLVRPHASPGRPAGGRVHRGASAGPSDRAQTPLVRLLIPVASPRRLPPGRATVGVEANPDPPRVVMRPATASDRRSWRPGAVRAWPSAPLPTSDQAQTPLVALVRPAAREGDRRLGWHGGWGRIAWMPRVPDPAPRAVRPRASRRIGDDRDRLRNGYAWTPYGPRSSANSRLPFDHGGWFNLYRNDGAGGPIDYSRIVFQTQSLTWSTPPLAPGTWRFGVRAADAYGEEQNADCAVAIVITPAYADATNTPLPPSHLRALATASASIRAEWWYPPTSGPTAPTGFHVYCTAGTSVSYATPAAAVHYSQGYLNTFAATLAGLADGQPYAIGVRAFNAAGEEANTAFVLATASAAGPSAVDSLTGSAT